VHDLEPVRVFHDYSSGTSSHGRSSPEVKKYFESISPGKVQKFLARWRNISALSCLTQKYSDHVKKSEYVEEHCIWTQSLFFIYFCVLLTEVRRRTQRLIFL